MPQRSLPSMDELEAGAEALRPDDGEPVTLNEVQKEGRRRSVTVSARFSPVDVSRIRSVAERDGVGITQLVRRWVLDALEGAEEDAAGAPRSTDDLMAALRESVAASKRAQQVAQSELRRIMKGPTSSRQAQRRANGCWNMTHEGTGRVGWVTMTHEVVPLSLDEIVERLLAHVNQADAGGPLQRLEVEFAEDADEQWALFITAVVRPDAKEFTDDQLVGLARGLNAGARQLGLGVPWYVRVQDEDAVTDDPAT